MRFGSVIAGACVAALAWGVSVAPAHAANLDANCDDNEVCLYKNSSFQATAGIHDRTSDDNDYDGNSFLNCSINCGLNDEVSSIRNTRNVQMFFYQHRNGGGAKLHVAAEGSRANLAQDPLGADTWNDRISSHCWLDTTRPVWCR
ncbi:peptidase inhibitor family I36 protein [Nonomuraea sp. NPDC050643]|uniref:peptidase inhibitor family I36 protein n=1 Tax=Nonomuraea sp. NPDC050643 TaxID=3155660 RepID=UPI00340D1D06